VAAVLFIILKKPKSAEVENTLTAQFQSQNEALLQKLNSQAQNIRELTDESLNRHFTNVDNKLESGRQTSDALLKGLGERLKITELLHQQVDTLNRILTNKQERGAFGELRLEQIVKDQLPTEFYEFQASLSRSDDKGEKRVIADCLIKLPPPSKPLCVDAKFPLPQEGETRNQEFRTNIKKHIKDISEKYIIKGVTDNKAVLFLPLNSVASLIKDAKIYEQAKQLQKQVALLGEDSHRLSLRWQKLRSHFSQANRDLDDVGTSVDKITANSTKITQLDFEEKPKLE